MTSPDQFSRGLCRAGLAQRVHVAADGDLPPHAGPGLLREAAPGVHHQHAVGREPVHVAVGVLPFCSFFLREEVKKKKKKSRNCRVAPRCQSNKTVNLVKTDGYKRP